MDSRSTVYANSARLERVIGHLIQNAIEATARKGQVRVRLKKEGGFRDNRNKGYRPWHERRIYPREAFQAIRIHKVSRHGHRCIRKQGVCVLNWAAKLGSYAACESDGTVFRIVLPLLKRSSTDGVNRKVEITKKARSREEKPKEVCK